MNFARLYSEAMLYLLVVIMVVLIIPGTPALAECEDKCVDSEESEHTYARAGDLGSYISGSFEDGLSGGYEIAQNDADSEPIYVAQAGQSASASGYLAGKDWVFSFAPYLWMTGLNGTLGARGSEADVDISFGDIWDNLDFAFQGHAEVFYKNKWGFFIDGTYMKLNTKNNKGPLNIDATVKINMWEFVGLYRAYTQPSAFTNSKGMVKPAVQLDVLAGGRYMNIDNTIDIAGSGPVGVGTSVSGDQGWFDFIVGTRGKWQPWNRVFFIARTDIGGFGLGFSSDFAWNLLGLVGFDVTDWMQFMIGYKVFYDKFTDGSGDDRFIYDAWMSGPITGLNFTF